MRATARRGEGPDRAADLQHSCPFVKMRLDKRRAPGGQVGLARKLQVERLEPPSGVQQKGGSIATQTRDEKDVAAQQVDLGALELIQLPGLRPVQQFRGLAKCAGLHA